MTWASFLINPRAVETCLRMQSIQKKNLIFLKSILNPKPLKKNCERYRVAFFFIFCMFVDPQKLDVKFCGSTSWRFQKLWIHKMVQKHSKRFCGNTSVWFKFLWIHIFLKSTLWIHKMALSVVWSVLCFFWHISNLYHVELPEKTSFNWSFGRTLNGWTAPGTGTLQHGWDQL